MNDFFKDLRIVEISSVLAGPAVGMFFAELGAEVIKIENKRTDGDVTRKWKLSGEPENSKVSAYFSSINYGKKYLYLDLTDDSDLEILKKEITQADIVTTNFKLGDAEKFGLTYQNLKSWNEKIIHCQLFGFWSDKSRPAFDAVLQAETGFMYMNGQPGSPPTKMPVALIDVLAAHQMKESILIALLKLARTGAGSYVEVSLEGSAIASLVNQATNWLMANHIPQRTGSIHPNIAPYGETFRCKDGKWLVLAVGNDRQFNSLMRTLGLENQAKEPAFTDNQSRVKNRTELAKVLETTFARLNRDSIVSKLLENKVPVGAVKNMKEVFETSVATSMLRHEEIQGSKTIRPSSIAFQFD